MGLAAIVVALIGVVVVAFSVMSVLFRRRNQPDRSRIADTLERFLNGTGSDWEWDDFVALPIQDQKLEAIRVRCLTLDKEFPPANAGAYCNEEGLNVLREYVRRLRSETPLGAPL